MHARVRHLAQPTGDGGVSRMILGHHTGLPLCRDERHPEAALQMTDEALHLSLRLSSVQLALPRQRVRMFDVIEKAWTKAMRAATIGVALLHDGFHAGVMHCLRRTAERQEGAFVAGSAQASSVAGASRARNDSCQWLN